MKLRKLANANVETDMGTYLVSGGCGFIGSHLVAALLDLGFTVRVLDNLSVGRQVDLDLRAELIVDEVSNTAAVREAMRGVVGCFHLAAISSVVRGAEQWHGTHTINAGGTVAVLEAARIHGGIPVVYASSAAVYGDARSGPLAEEVSCNPLSAYGADKRASELHALAGFAAYGVPSIGFRLFNVYGPRRHDVSDHPGVVDTFANRITSGLPIAIYGDGHQLRDFIHVNDVIPYLLAGMRNLHSSACSAIVNVCTGKATSILDLAHAIGRLAGNEPIVTYRPQRAGDIRRSVGDTRLARAMLGLSAQIMLDQGLEDVLTKMWGR